MGKLTQNNAIDNLFEAILSLNTREEAYLFFEDLCTKNEVISLAQRFEVAKMLYDHRTYQAISETTGASTATISRVNRILTEGNGTFPKLFDLLP